MEWWALYRCKKNTQLKTDVEGRVTEWVVALGEALIRQVTSTYHIISWASLS